MHLADPGRRCARLLPSFLAGALLATAPAHAEDKTAEIDKLFGWATAETPGCACAVSLQGQVVASRAYGLADLEHGTPIGPETVFDVGSVVKQFVAAATLLLVEEGKLSLTEDIHRYIPELPDYGHKITLDHLMTHTSGIRDWTAILMLAATKEDALTLTLRQRGLNFLPGEECSYSNSGYVLLKEIVARTSGMTFGEFAQKRLFEPLGMKSSTYRHELREVVRNRAIAYEKEGSGWKMAMLLDEERGGGGGLLSTTGDLLIWNDALTNGRLGTFVTSKLQEPARLNNGRKIEYGRGLFLDDDNGRKVVWHTGSAGAYKSLVARYPDDGLSVAILCNAGESADQRTKFVSRIHDLFVPPPAASSSEPRSPAANAPAAAAVAEADLKRMEGLFFSEPAGDALRLLAQKGQLRVEGGPPLVPVATDRFRVAEPALSFMSDDQFEVRLVSADHLELKSMEGKITRYRRAQPWVPSAADLAGLAGRYASEEIGTTFQIVAVDGALQARLEHSPAKSLPLRPVDRDVFQVSRMFLRFRRDTSGRVIAIDYSNPLLRHVELRRVSEQASGR